METSLMALLRAAVDPLIFGTLGLMSVLMLAAVFERLWFYRRVCLGDFQSERVLNVALTDRLALIYTVGSSAPYVGLLGTVAGILITFYDIGQGGDIAVSDIMVGLALALKATAAGLFVAIPAVMFNNALARRVEVLTALWHAGREP
ncbi:MAG: TonB-system energizer ExbB [Chromatiales bacterium]|jgi:biopolymer transport protein ExbB|nr:TonB-system energizer ExbB [Chromatiales bacterium]MDX9766874.1 TonB-system energizer ExbB [Ectothiorhodospiraceae bacterium]